MIVFTVSGGITGASRVLRLDADGAAVAEGTGAAVPGRLPPGDVDGITEALDASGLFDPGAAAERTFPPPAGAADVQSYEIRYRGATVLAHDTVVPDRLAPAVRRLRLALQSVQRGA